MGPQPLWMIGPIALRSTTLIWTWLAMALILLLFYVASRNRKDDVPSAVQNLIEFIVEFVTGFLHDRLSADHQRQRLYNLLVAVFMFVLMANLIGLFPLFFSPTSDANTTIGLALIVFILIHAYGIHYRGVGGHLSSFFKPFALLFPINLLEALSNPATLALRLFGNIFAGTILIGLGIQLAPVAISGLGPVVGLIGSVLVQTLALSFNTFIDLIQSFIFMVLTLAYVAGSMGAVGEH